jgi:predicted nucleic acid-binding protein
MFSYGVIHKEKAANSPGMPVSNASPLIHMSRLGKLRFAQTTFGSVFIPDAVRRETIEAGAKEGFPDAPALEKLEADGWLVTSPLSKRSLEVADSLSEGLGRGEAEAIALALERKERLFMDDQKGRAASRLYGVETVTTLGLMLEMRVGGAMEPGEYQRNVKEYGSQGWIGADVVQLYLEKGRELG